MIVPAPSAAESTTPCREIAHWMASRAFTFDSTGEAARSWSTWYCSEPTLSIATELEVAVLAVTGSLKIAASTAPVRSAETIDWSSGMTRNSSVAAPGLPA